MLIILQNIMTYSAEHFFTGIKETYIIIKKVSVYFTSLLESAVWS